MPASSVRLLAAIVLAGVSCLGAARAQTTASVTVNAAAAIATLSAGDIGVNTPVYDGNMLDSGVKTQLANAGFALRFPGGSYSDIYNWQTAQVVQNQTVSVSTANSFDAFMGIVKATNATPVLTVNYGSDPTGTTGGSTSLAAAWVQYANVTKKYGVKYWEIGNEVYGNGEYGANWETDLHTAKDPTTYGTNVVAFSKAMKAIDPTIKIGAVLTAPGNWPDGQTPSWNDNVLAQAINNIDFVILHWYPQAPGYETDAGLLGSPTAGTYSIPNMMATVRSLLTQYGGAAAAARIQVLVTETNSVYANPGKQTTSVVNGLFMADSMLTWLENGATNIDVWDLHNSSYTQGNNAATLYGSTGYGDFGILSNASAGEPSLDTPFPAYYGMKMVSLTGQGGDTLVTTTSSNSLLTTHAVKQANGDLALMLINKDPSNTTTATVSVAGFTPAASGTSYVYGSGSATIKSSTLSGTGGASFTVAVPFYSIATVVLTPAPTVSPAYTLAASPASLSVVQGASGTSKITVTPTGGFTGSVALSISGVPAGVTASFSPASTTGSSVLTFTTTSAATAGLSSVMTITGTSGTLSATTTVSLTVTAAPSFALSASPSSLSLKQGSSGSATVTIAPSGGFTGTVALSASGLPSGVTASFSPASATTTSTLTLAASATAATGSSSVTLTGTSGSLSKTVTLPLTVTAASSGGTGAGPATFTGVESSSSSTKFEEDVDLKATGTITALTITVTVPATGASVSSLSSTVGSQVVTSSTSSGGKIVVTFTLASGKTIAAGSYTFASQFTGNGTTHNAAGDTWTASYTTGGQTYTQSGVM
jgi:hypothetical protein